MKKSYKEAAKEVLLNHSKGLHISEIAEKCYHLYSDKDIESIKLAINQAILNDIKKGKLSEFMRIKQKSGRYKKGYFKLKRRKKKSHTRIAEKIRPTSYEEIEIKDLYKGKAGEFAVLSELMFNGFNAGLMAIDEGIDVVAMKDNKKFHIQVKTRTYRTSISVQIKYNDYEKNRELDTYYIVVLRYKSTKEGRFQNEFFIFHPRDIEVIFFDEIRTKQDLKLLIKIESGKFLLKGLNISHHLNNFDIIK